MSGHSKWSTIKRKKAAIDAKRGDLFGKLARAIAIAARDNPDPGSNSRLRDAIVRARAANMPNDKIERAIKKVSDKDADTLSDIQLEFIGPGDAAIIVTGITDNSNRTISELRKLAAGHGGRMVQQGSVAWMFKKVMVIRARTTDDPGAQQLAVIDAGADDVSEDGSELYVTAGPENAEVVRNALGDTVIEASLSYVPTTMAPVADEKVLGQLRTLLNAFEDHDDVQDVITNTDI